MAEEIKDRRPIRPWDPNISLREMALFIEDKADVLHESGYLKEAAYLVKWARELRQKASESAG